MTHQIVMKDKEVSFDNVLKIQQIHLSRKNKEAFEALNIKCTLLQTKNCNM